MNLTDENGRTPELRWLAGHKSRLERHEVGTWDDGAANVVMDFLETALSPQ